MSNELELENRRLRKENEILTELTILYREKLSKPIPTAKPVKQTITQITELIEDWIRKRDHEKCWYYPEIFESIAKLLGIIIPDNNVNLTKEEFVRGCEQYQLGLCFKDNNL